MLAETSEVGTSRARGAWMRRFLTVDGSLLLLPVVDMQRRATWICLAIVLQALSTLDYQWYLSFSAAILAWGALIPFVLVTGSFVAIYMAFQPVTKAAAAGEEAAQKRPRRWQRIVLILTLLASLGGLAELGYALYLDFSYPPQFTNDGTSLDTNAAALLLQGHNPYTDSNILSIVRQYPIEPYWTTPLRLGQLAGRLDYPQSWEMRSILDTDLKSGSAPEFESKVSYPALAFLTLVPPVWLHIDNVLPFYLLCYIALVAIGWKIARPELRPLVLLAALANVGLLNSVAGGNVDLLYLLLVVLAWLLLDQRWWSAILLGLAATTKQPAWLFIPFYAILIFRRYGIRETIGRLSIIAVVFLAFNLPFMLWNWQAWLAGVLAPVADPMFPLGVGIVSLGTLPIFTYLPATAYTLMEAAALLFCLGWYWRICKRLPEAVMLLAYLPLFFAWRSLPSYFYCAPLPLLILLMARLAPNEKIADKPALEAL